MYNDEKLSTAFLEAARIRESKRDYGGIKEYFPYGDLSFAQMVHVKSQRLMNLADSKDGLPNNESIEDSIIDLLNYASYWYEYRKGILDE